MDLEDKNIKTLKITLSSIIDERLDKIEKRIDATIEKMIKEEMEEAVKQYMNQTKDVIFSELISTLIDKNREYEMKEKVDV
jgi:predicted DNA-binding protein